VAVRPATSQAASPGQVRRVAGDRSRRDLTDNFTTSRTTASTACRVTTLAMIRSRQRRYRRRGHWTTSWALRARGPIHCACRQLRDPPRRLSQVAKLTNVQCESCHRPNDSLLHLNTDGSPDLVLDASASASHPAFAQLPGEPPRHGRYQRMAGERHGQYDLAEAEATGELAALGLLCRRRLLRPLPRRPRLLGVDRSTRLEPANHRRRRAVASRPGRPERLRGALHGLGLSSRTRRAGDLRVCHDPTREGNARANPTATTVRIADNTKVCRQAHRPRRWTGALCMTCHNTRKRPAQTDAVPINTAGAWYHGTARLGASRRAHGPRASTRGRGDRSPHSFISDTCTNLPHGAVAPAPVSATSWRHQPQFAAAPRLCVDARHRAVDAAGSSNGSKARWTSCTAGRVRRRESADQPRGASYTVTPYKRATGGSAAPTPSRRCHGRRPQSKSRPLRAAPALRADRGDPSIRSGRHVTAVAFQLATSRRPRATLCDLFSNARAYV